MITRAQAEALLTLAESLEACERLNLNIFASVPGEFVKDTELDLLTGSELRTATAGLIPAKPEPEFDTRNYQE